MFGVHAGIIEIASSAAYHGGLLKGRRAGARRVHASGSASLCKGVGSDRSLGGSLGKSPEASRGRTGRVSKKIGILWVEQVSIFIASVIDSCGGLHIRGVYKTRNGTRDITWKACKLVKSGESPRDSCGIFKVRDIPRDSTRHNPWSST